MCGGTGRGGILRQGRTHRCAIPVQARHPISHRPPAPKISLKNMMFSREGEAPGRKCRKVLTEKKKKSTIGKHVHRRELFVGSRNLRGWCPLRQHCPHLPTPRLPTAGRGHPTRPLRPSKLLQEPQAWDPGQPRTTGADGLTADRVPVPGAPPVPPQARGRRFRHRPGPATPGPRITATIAPP